MDDLISRQAAIQWVKANCNPYGKPTLDYESGIRVMEHLKRMSSAQPEILACGEGELNVPGTNVGDMISRQAAIDECYPVTVDGEVYEVVQVETLMGLPSVQPEPMCVAKVTLTDEQVKEAFEKAKGEILAVQSVREERWIPFKTRSLTEEEKEEHPEWECILDCILPDDGQAILVSINLKGHERVQYDEFYTDDGSYLDSGYEIGSEATAWMPLPEPYREEKQDA